MDEKKREIERRAASGDPEAIRSLQILSLRAGKKFSLNKPKEISWMKWLSKQNYSVQTSYSRTDEPNTFIFYNRILQVGCQHKHPNTRSVWKCARRHLYSEEKKTLLT